MIKTNVTAYRFFALVLASLLLLGSCLSTTTYLAPQEMARVGPEQEVTFHLSDGSIIPLFGVTIEGGVVTGYDGSGGKIQLDSSDIESVRIVKTSEILLYPIIGASVVGTFLLIGMVRTASAP